MKKSLCTFVFVLCLAALGLAAVDVDATHQIAPDQLAKALQASKAPLILNVGPHALFQQAHIKGAEYVGGASSEEGRAKLRERVKSLPHDTAIVLYCGCCPWDHCPNVRPAFAELQHMGFSNVKVLYIANNIGADWVDKGYPTEKGM